MLIYELNRLEKVNKGFDQEEAFDHIPKEMILEIQRYTNIHICYKWLRIYTSCQKIWRIRKFKMESIYEKGDRMGSSIENII